MSDPREKLKADLAAYRELARKQRNQKKVWIVSRDFEALMLKLANEGKKGT